MKSYYVHRLESCPTGEHVVIDDATGQEVTRDCTCPALVVSASGPPGPTVPHLMQWSRPELARLVGEFDRGYFDADGSPPRRLSMFVSAFQTELLDLMERNPFAAVVRVLTQCVFDQLTFCFATYQLSFRLMPGQWAVINLPVDGGKETTYRTDTKPAGLHPQILWERPVSDDEQRATEADIRGQVRELLTGKDGWTAAATDTTTLLDDEQQITAVDLSQLAAAAAQLEQWERDGAGDVDPSALRRGRVLATRLTPKGLEADVVYADEAALLPPPVASKAPPAGKRRNGRKRGRKS